MGGAVSLFAVCLILLSPELTQPAAGEALYQDDMKDIGAWRQMPSWLPNPSQEARLTQSQDGARFSVPEAGRGMKWQRGLKDIWLEDSPWLVVRCRAHHLRPVNDYFVWLQAGEGVEALRLDQLPADRQWHTLATHVSALAGADRITAIAVQAQADADEAWIEIAWIAFLETPPPDAQIIGENPKPAPEDWVLSGHMRGTWEPQPTWLSNPAERCRHERRGGADVFTVAQAGRGMKWVVYFDAPIEPVGYRYLSLRMRGRGNIAAADYALCVLGDAAPDGADYTVLAPPAAAVTGGRWRTLNLPLEPARRHPRLVGLAVQAQAGEGPAALEIADVRLTSTQARLRLDDSLDIKPGWPAGAARQFAAVDMGPSATMTVGEAKTRFRVADWFTDERVTVESIMFHVKRSGMAVAANAMAEESEIAIPLSGRASEVYLLALARLIGAEESLHGGGRLVHLGDVDRLRVILHYADGEERQARPARIPEGGFGVEEGAQVLTVRADPTRELKQMALYVGTRQAVVGIAGVTVNRARRRRFEKLWQAPSLPRVAQVKAALPDLEPSARLNGQRLVLANRHLEAEFDLSRAAALARLLHRAIGAECAPALVLRSEGSFALRSWATKRAEQGASLLRRVAKERQPLFDVKAGERFIGGDEFELVSAAALTTACGYELSYRCAKPALEVRVKLTAPDEPRITCDISVRNISGQPQTITPSGPHLALAIGAPQAMWYVIPASATVLSDRPIDYAGWYSGAEVSLQFLDTFSAKSGGGACLMVRDLDSLEKRYQLRKSDVGVSMGLTYQQRLLSDGEEYALAPVDVMVHRGDWHEAFAAYRRWARTWYKPASLRPRWWREVFNFRQRFLYWLDPMYDAEAREYRMEAALEEAEREFGGCEYLHIFDWGNCGPYGRIYGRTGDYDPGDYLPGGWDGFRAAVERARRRGMRVGYYIEGYLLDERGKLGQAHGREWQMLDASGAGMRWPKSTELYVCPAVARWQEVQATTYARMVERMDADGMYLDELGFAGPWKWCWSQIHGHRSPGSSLQAEHALTRRVRAAMSAVKPEAVLYTEDTPTDVNSQYQEGAFCYSMTRHRSAGSVAPLKLFRYAFPDFKNIEILNCDNPTATWATGVRWAFWNGEGLWLEGKADEWFAPQTRRAIRDCHRVLREHRDAFAGDCAEPLAPTLAGDIYANVFRGAQETAYTILNARPETYGGEVIAVAHRPGMRYFDAFAQREIKPRIVAGQARLSLTIAPEGVGCIVCRTRGPARREGLTSGE